MPYESYIDYLKSEDWRERRKEMMEEAEWICDECGERATQLHHLSYDNLGAEALYIDVRPLCTACHKEEHGNKDDMAGYGDYGE